MAGFTTGLIAVLATSAPVVAADPVEVPFASTGAEQSWTVPDGVTSIGVVLIGGRGGSAGGLAGGWGHRVTATLAVTPGSTLYVEVGGNGEAASGPPGAGFNGGGSAGSAPFGTLAGGGGASDIRTISRSSPGTIDSRLIVAGGGGGVGTDSDGGNAGQQGDGGLLGGGAGTAAAGGAGGVGDTPGSDGDAGVGGAGATWCGFDVCGSGTAGGGGGGGYYGGGGGAGMSADVQIQPSGGGGGGSSFTGTATNTAVTLDDTGTPSITITYTIGTDPTPPPTAGEGVVEAVISMADSTLCLELSATSVDFGQRQFGDAGVVGAPDIDVANCSETPMSLLVRGTNATAAGAAWTLVNDGTTCADTLGTDRYHLGLLENAPGSTAEWRLGTTNTELMEVPAGVIAPFRATIDAACPGSTGAGQQMSMQIVFVATEVVP